MNIRAALIEQYHAALAMLAECVENCPPELWAAPTPPGTTDQRAFWRITFHALYFTHLYLAQSLDGFQPPPASSVVGGRSDFEGMWKSDWEMEPFDLPIGTTPCQQAEMLEYILFVDSLIDKTVDGLDLDTQESGIPWYKRISKLSHQLMNVRHLQGHVGQLSELLMLRGIDIKWVGASPGLKR